MANSKDLRLLVAKNLRYFMDRQEAKRWNANSLAKAAGVSPNSVTNLLKPERRTVTTDKPDGYPQLDTLHKVSKQLGCDVWELLHPDIERSLIERELYDVNAAYLRERIGSDTGDWAPLPPHRPHPGKSS